MAMQGFVITRPSAFLAVVALAAAAGARPASAQSPWALPTKAFVQAAASSDMFEITEAHDAVAQTQNPQVRAFAQEMIRDHTADGEALRRAAEASGLPPPTMSLGGDQARMLGAAQSLRGADFDRVYLKQQVLAHQQALVVEQGYAAGGADPAIREAARSAIPVIQRHLEMARRLSDAVGGS